MNREKGSSWQGSVTDAAPDLAKQEKDELCETADGLVRRIPPNDTNVSYRNLRKRIKLLNEIRNFHALIVLYIFTKANKRLVKSYN